MDTLMLAAASRTLVGKKVAKVRGKKLIPGVVYGHDVTNVNVEVDHLAMQKILTQAGSSSLVDLRIDQKKPVKVLIHAVQRHPTKSDISHVDFYAVKMTEKLQTDIELNFIGESAAVKEQGGILVKSLDRVKVECLPGDLVPAIDVDISSLKTFEDKIHVSDIVVPAGLTVMEQSEEVVASVTPPRSESEIEELSGKVEEDVTAVSGVEKKEEPAAEGAEPSADVAAPVKPTKESK